MDIESIIWETLIPLRIVLSSSDLKTDSCCALNPFYISIPSISYFPLLIPQIQNHFQPTNQNKLWLTYQGSPIR